MSSSITKPCPSCAKPLRPDAANCWFCGEVFGTVRCRECAAAIRIGQPACQMCGAATPPPPPAPTGPPKAARAGEQECKACGGPVNLAAIQCKHCGAPLEGPVLKKSRHWDGRRIVRSRGGSLIAAGVSSLLCLFFGSGFAVGASNFGSVTLWVATFAFLAFGLLIATAGVVLAFFDLKGMRTGRVNPDGRGRTFAGGVVCGFSVVLHWFVIGWCIFALL